MNKDPIDVQLENFRHALVGILGPYAWLMTDDQVREYRARVQEKIDREFGDAE